MPLCASATPSEMPICVDGAELDAGMAIGLVEVPELAHLLLEIVGGEHPVLVLDHVPDFDREPRKVIGEASQFLRASSCHFAQTSSWRLPIATLRSAMRLRELGVAGDALLAEAGELRDAERGVAERADRAGLHAAIVHRPFADVDLAEADLDEVALTAA